MITEDQFKRARQLLSSKEELQRFLEGFEGGQRSSTVGLMYKRDYGGVGHDDKDSRFNVIQKELISGLNAVVVDSLKKQISEIELQLAEHIQPGA